MAMFIDVECFKDYFLVVFHNGETGKSAYFEMFEGKPLNVSRISDLMRRNITVSFNGLNYDLPMIQAALDGRSCEQLKKISDEIIKSNLPSWKIARQFDISIPTSWDHIDIFDVIPGRSSLKIYAGRIAWPMLQDLPLEPNASVSTSDREELKRYCLNDTHITRALFELVGKEIDLRVKMGDEYGVDLRSKSDAQIAETVLKHQIEAESGKALRVPRVAEDTTYRYKNPGIVSFDTPEIQQVFDRILAHDFELAGNGSIKLPDWLKETRIRIGQSEYQMGIGGLHSCEKSQSVYAGDDHDLFELDVASYYPSIILQQGVVPENMGQAFVTVYERLVAQRLEAKRGMGDPDKKIASLNKAVSDTLKIVLNGSFGKFGSKYSVLYSPDLLIQITLTGQLALLMLIERLEAAGARVVSANTDGVVVFAPKSLEDVIANVKFGWELDTSYELERTDYRSIHSRDVNNYFAVKLNGDVKRKGAYAKSGFMKNPQFEIVSEAVAEHLSGKSDYKDTIRNSRSLEKFVMIRQVTGGAQWRSEFLGKAVRFYYSTEVLPDEHIEYAKNSNRVPQSSGARPCLNMPSDFPEDVDRERYVGMAQMVFKQIGVHDA